MKSSPEYSIQLQLETSINRDMICQYISMQKYETWLLDYGLFDRIYGLKKLFCVNCTVFKNVSNFHTKRI